MKRLNSVFSVSYLGLVFPLIFLGAPFMLQGSDQSTTAVSRYDDAYQIDEKLQIPEEIPFTFEISLAELGYGEQVLDSPYDAVEYNLRLPEGWEFLDGGDFELSFSYAYDRLNATEGEAPLSLLGDVSIVFDGETQLVYTIRESQLKDHRLRVDLPPALLNDSTRSVHNIRVTLDAGLICDIPHYARLIISPASYFSLVYDELPIVPDLARYPRPFHQRSFEPDQVRFVLPAQPTEMELASAAAVAAKLGDIAYGLIISGTTDLELLNELEAGRVPQDHLIVIGTPERNRFILGINELDVLPVPFQERQLSLVTDGPAIVAPGGVLTYSLMLTNSTQKAFSDLSLVDKFPFYAQISTCDPLCSEGADQQVSWSIPSLAAGEAFSCTLELRLSKVITDSVVENTVTLIDSDANLVQANTLATRVTSDPLSASGQRLSASGVGDYFAVQREHAVSEYDGIVQEIVSPWNQARAILIITGVSDEAVYKASQAMGFESSFPGMEGPFALVREVHPTEESPQESITTEFSLADLGYSDNVLRGSSRSTTYDFEMPVNWQLTEAAYFELHFSHSQLLDPQRSLLSILFNGKPLTSVPLNVQNVAGEVLKVELPSSQVRPGQRNTISVQVEMQSPDPCADLDLWTLISGESLLHLDHKEQHGRFLDLNLYPYPFDLPSNLAETLFVLPTGPEPAEWVMALQLIASLGGFAGGPDFVPAVMIGDTLSEDELAAYHLIALGRPSRNPILQKVNSQLPQPFLPESDLIEQKLDEVILRLPPDLSLGYVQLIPSPWNEARALLAVTGTTDEGVDWAIRFLRDNSLNWQLKGDLALIRGTSINSLNTRTLSRGYVAASMATVIPEMTSEPTTVSTTPTPTMDKVITDTDESTQQLSHATSITPYASLPNWVILLIGLTLIAIVIISAIALRQSRRSR